MVLRQSCAGSFGNLQGSSPWVHHLSHHVAELLASGLQPSLFHLTLTIENCNYVAVRFARRILYASGEVEDLDMDEILRDKHM